MKFLTRCLDRWSRYYWNGGVLAKSSRNINKQYCLLCPPKNKNNRHYFFIFGNIVIFILRHFFPQFQWKQIISNLLWCNLSSWIILECIECLILREGICIRNIINDANNWDRIPSSSIKMNENNINNSRLW